MDDLRLNLAVRWRQQTAEDKARVRQHAEQERAEYLDAIRRDHRGLVEYLKLAVPVLIEYLRHMPLSAIEARATELAGAACEWDVLMGGAKPGQMARAANAIAEGLAAVSFCPGGATLFGLHFEAVHPESPRASGQQEASP